MADEERRFRPITIQAEDPWHYDPREEPDLQDEIQIQKWNTGIMICYLCIVVMFLFLMLCPFFGIITQSMSAISGLALAVAGLVIVFGGLTQPHPDLENVLDLLTTWQRCAITLDKLDPAEFGVLAEEAYQVQTDLEFLIRNIDLKRIKGNVWIHRWHFDGLRNVLDRARKIEKKLAEHEKRLQDKATKTIAASCVTTTGQAARAQIRATRQSERN